MNKKMSPKNEPSSKTKEAAGNLAAKIADAKKKAAEAEAAKEAAMSRVDDEKQERETAAKKAEAEKKAAEKKASEANKRAREVEAAKARIDAEKQEREAAAEKAEAEKKAAEAEAAKARVDAEKQEREAAAKKADAEKKAAKAEATKARDDAEKQDREADAAKDRIDPEKAAEDLAETKAKSDEKKKTSEDENEPGAPNVDVMAVLNQVSTRALSGRLLSTRHVFHLTWDERFLQFGDGAAAVQEKGSNDGNQMPPKEIKVKEDRPRGCPNSTLKQCKCLHAVCTPCLELEIAEFDKKKAEKDKVAQPKVKGVKRKAGRTSNKDANKGQCIPVKRNARRATK